MSNPTYKPSEGRREEFRKYLEKNGVMDALTKVLVSLYEEPDKPEDALGYIRDRLAIQAGIETYAAMKTKLEEFESKIGDLSRELENAKITEEPPKPAEPEVETADDASVENAAAGEVPPGEEVSPENVEETQSPEKPE